ncbi:hypothetical protein ASPWEDRAFT_734797 [Aspergillus wentii DTO 134E9]|uniref:Uncharacterized protein n=1 Tax=Aspergillus wentii DTO 134E9 TaxID=1073089 RepID=A0A1L9RU10_ASPWE|nr:uncharacterized protein ASPWEDRAFT_734797 [Aspergillus wentii DTO 134E9]OJJ38410.1 hypothetical protein ASPWEDRAFT_734797 [Aspergillus wentii DTO 134E9]
MAFNGDANGGPPGRKTRPREGLHLRPLNVEKGAKRDSFPPQTATWRNNLIALSQRRNLLFVAYSHQIYVWEPSGSFQILGSKPEMIITPVMRSPHSGGYIMPHAPHAINNILVDDLGRDEVLLLATDSGNICGYRVEAIYSALERAAGGNQKRPLDGSHVDPFFVEYVDASAWGLAIHKFARLIAVSANTGLITVFAFALVNPVSEKHSDSFEEEEDLTDYGQTWLHIKNNTQFMQLQHLMPENRRTRNIKLSYTGHFTNIPSVSFLNCDLDPNGKWMVSTDIDNKLIIWKIWESLERPFNVYHFNDVTFKPFPETLHNDSERGWAVLALDPRTFHTLKSTRDACGGQPQHRLKGGRTVLDLTNLNSRIPDASQLYNYFPPAVKPEPEQPVLPDIFEPDCCISGPGNASQSTVHSTSKHQAKDAAELPHQSTRIGTSQGLDLPSESANLSSTFTGNARFLDSADTFSHRAVDGSVQEENMSQDSRGSSVDLNDDLQHTTDQDGGNANGHGGLSVQEGTNPNANGIPHHPGQGPLTTAEFLQFALLEALGGDIPGAEEYFNNNIDDYSDLDEDDGPEDQEMDDVDDGQQSNGDAPEMGAIAYQVFDRMLRRAFPGDPASYEQADRLTALSPAPATANLNYPKFPILHFSQTDIRLIPSQIAPHASVVCGAPLRQPFTHPIVSVRACDRFNMVKYIPEHGIVIAASQKGRAAVIALTESESTGLAFRVDWIVPFESQEKYGDRPLIPLLGMSVSPVQGFEMPPDVPYIPRGIDHEKDLTFHYQYTNQDEAGTPQPIPADHTGIGHSMKSDEDGESKGKRTRSSNSRSGSTPELGQSPQLTLPECHAWATHVYQPDESWRGWNPSRRYRLILMYADHTVMSYEFWYDWSTGGTDVGEENDEVEYLVV